MGSNTDMNRFHGFHTMKWAAVQLVVRISFIIPYYNCAFFLSMFFVRARMEHVLSIYFVMWYLSLHLTRGVGHRVGAGQEESLSNVYRSNGEPKAAICNAETYWGTAHCAKDLSSLAIYGFPWVVANVQETHNQNVNRHRSRNNIQDPLDPIKQVCGSFQEFLKCLDQHAIPEVCLVGGDGALFRLHTIFKFICYVQPMDIDLLHSLRCLQETRVLDLMVFHLANKPGTRIDDMAQGTVNALFKFLNSDVLTVNYFINAVSATNRVIADGLVCLPESVLSQDFSFIIDSMCGTHAAGLARDFYLYFRRRYQYLLAKTGFPTNICDKETKGSAYPIPRRNEEAGAAPGDAKRDGASSRLFNRFLEDNSPGTAMDTVYGRVIRNIIGWMTRKEFCIPTQLDTSLDVCILLSYDPSGKGTFNVLQFAHSTGDLFTPFTDSSRMEIFRTCWNLLQEICGANATYLDYRYRVSAESRQIQSMMDNLTCGWQDMLLARYLEAAEHGNIWPTGLNALQRPMFLSLGYYSFRDWATSMNDLVRVLNRGVNEIAARCSLPSAKRIRLFYERLRYGWDNEIRLVYMNMMKGTQHLP